MRTFSFHLPSVYFVRNEFYMYQFPLSYHIDEEWKVKVPKGAAIFFTGTVHGECALVLADGKFGWMEEGLHYMRDWACSEDGGSS